MRKFLNAEYAGIHAFYWMTYGVVCSFASVFLLSRGYSNADIGVILALGNVVAVFVQPLLADVADRSKRISLIGVIQLVTLFTMALTSLTFIITKASMALAVVFVMMLAWVTALQPLINSLVFKLEESGYNIKFGVTRSIGSLAYAVLCLFLGTLVENFGVKILPLSGEFIMLVLLGILCITGVHFRRACSMRELAAPQNAVAADCAEAKDINLIEFVKRNKLFLMLNVGVAGIFFSNAIFNNFMLQIVENVGGNSEDMGRIFSLMAFLEIPPMFLFDKFRQKFSCQTMLRFAAVCFTLKVLWIFSAKSVGMVFAGQFFQLVSFGVFLPAMIWFIDEIMDKGEAVKGQALYTTVITVSTVFASLLGGFVLDVSGPHTLLFIALLITGAGALLFVSVIGKIKKNK